MIRERQFDRVFYTLRSIDSYILLNDEKVTIIEPLSGVLLVAGCIAMMRIAIGHLFQLHDEVMQKYNMENAGLIIRLLY